VQDIRRVIDLLVERQIPAIFVETSVSSDVVEAIQAGARSRGQNVIIGGSLYSDAMGAADTVEGTYLGMIRANVDTIARALRGETTEEGTGS
jgi:manganese/zinc/iron transport system substrate-binding protein